MARSHHCGGPARVPSFAFPLPLRAGTKISAARRTQLRRAFEEARAAQARYDMPGFFFVGPKLSGPCPTEHKMLPAKICDDAMLRAAQRLLMLRYRGPRETSTAKDPIVILFQVLEDFLAKMAPPARSTKITPRMLNDRWTQRVDAAGWACPYPRRPSACVAAATSHASVRAGRGARPAAATGTCGTLR